VIRLIFPRFGSAFCLFAIAAASAGELLQESVVGHLGTWVDSVRVVIEAAFSLLVSLYNIPSSMAVVPSSKEEATLVVVITTFQSLRLTFGSCLHR
jgi:hypothetical protein